MLLKSEIINESFTQVLPVKSSVSLVSSELDSGPLKYPESMSGDNSDFSVIFFFFFLLRMTLLVLFCTLDSLLLEDSFVPSDLRAWKGTVKGTGR